MVYLRRMADDWKAHIDMAFENAEKGISKITQGIIDMEGMTGIKTRHFYNNMLNREDARYLEIGTWKGSSVCSAMCGNRAKVVCIDNWSEFGGPKEDFLANFTEYKGANDASFIESDCYKVNADTLPSFNMYLYDGEHSWDNHYNALNHYYRCMDDRFVFIVDDWNWAHVRDATFQSLHVLGVTIEYTREVRTTTNDSEPLKGSPEERAWHNGIFVALLRK